MSYKNLEKKKEMQLAWRKANKGKYNEYQRRYQKAWRERNKDKVKEYNNAKRNNGIASKALKKSILSLSDSYLKEIIRRQPGKTIDQKRKEVLQFRIKKILKICKIK